MGDQYDIFFSYAHADKDAVKPVLAALFAQGLRVFHDETDITDGQSITRRVTEGLTGARMLVAWYSKTYPTRRACQWELTAAIIAAQCDTSDTQAVERRILPLNPESGVHHIQPLHIRDQLFIPTNGVDPAKLASQVAARLTGLERSFSQFHRLTRPNWYGSNLRLGSNRFVGRVPDLWAIHSGLSQHNFAMITGGNTGLVQVQGMGGIGKTLLAEEYTLRFSAAYPGGIFWLSAVKSEAWSTQIFRIAGHLGLATANLNPDQVEGLLRGTLSNLGRYLWIVDDLPTDAGRDMLLQWSAPSANGVTLVTTRSIRMDGSGLVHRLDVLSYDEAFELLTNRRIPKSEAEHTAAQEILTQLGNHALAVDVARAAVEKLGYVDFLNRLRNLSKDATGFAAKLVGELPTGHEPQIAATLLDSINRLNEDGLRFLQLAALLAPAPIPQALIIEVFSQLSADAEVSIDQAILGMEAAMQEALAKRISGADDAPDAVSVHVLVSRTIRFHAREAPPSVRKAAVEVLANRMQKAHDIRNHSGLLPLVPHARALTEHLPDNLTAGLLGWLGRFNHERGAYVEAEVDFRRTVEARTQILGAEHRATLSSTNNLAEALQAQGNYDGARSLHEGVLGVCRQVLGAEHSDTLISMNNLAAILQDQGNHSRARSLHEEVFAICRRVLGVEHLTTLTSMANLAAILWIQGKHTHAQELEDEALAIRRRVLGAEPPTTLGSMNNLALTLWNQKDYVSARELQEAVLVDRRRLLGPEHPDTLNSMNSLALIILAQGDFVAAKARQQELLAIYRRVRGEEHPDTLTSMNNLAVTLFHMGEIEKARALVTEALSIIARKYGPNPSFSQTLTRTAIHFGLLSSPDEWPQ